MLKNNAFTKILAILGAIFAWIPILGTLLLAIISFLQKQGIQLEIPPGLSLFTLLGGSLLVWAAYRAERDRDMILGGFALCLIFWVVPLGLLMIGAFAIPKTIPMGIGKVLAIILSILINILGFLFVLAMVNIAARGLQLVRDLFKPSLVPENS